MFFIEFVHAGGGRTGKFFASEHYFDAGFSPEFIIGGKGLLQGIIFRTNYFRKNSKLNFKHYESSEKSPYFRCGTWVSNALLDVQTYFTLKTIHEEDLIRKAAATGHALFLQYPTHYVGVGLLFQMINNFHPCSNFAFLCRFHPSLQIDAHYFHKCAALKAVAVEQILPFSSCGSCGAPVGEMDLMVNAEQKLTFDRATFAVECSTCPRVW
jgi:hypothetical protein